MLDAVSKPQSINKLIANMLNDKETFIRKDNHLKSKNYIQILKHWSQMNGCIFKSVGYYFLKMKK
jgi:hypothetical protein